MSTPAIEVFPRRGVDIERIESELRAMWREARTSTRACMGNLVVVCPDAEDLRRATGHLARITAAYPSRAIALCGDVDAPTSGPDAWITAHCRFSPGQSKQVCCEQITLQASGAAVDQLPSAVRSLLLADLPVSVWWRGSIERAGALHERLAALADHLVVDSDAHRGARAVATLARLVRGRAALADLAWERLAPWQEQIARFFDPPGRRGHPAAIDRVMIAHTPAAGGGPSGEALLLVGWLAARLGWRGAAGEGAEGPMGRIDVQIAERAHAGIGPGGLCAVQISCRRALPAIVIHLWREEDPTLLRAKEDSETACGLPRCVRAELEDEASLVVRVLRAPARDRLLEDSVTAAAALGWTIGSDAAP